MTKLFTPRLGLIKPQPGTGEPQDIADINTSFDKIDAWAGAILVNDGVIPSTGDLFDGAFVKEKTSGKVWVAQRNIGGTFDRIWVQFPFLGIWTSNPNIPTGAYAEWGLSSFNAGSVNAVAGDVVSNRFVVPVTGIWTFTNHIRWGASGAGDRWQALAYNGTVAQIDFSTEVVHKPEAVSGVASSFVSYSRRFASGTTVVPCYRQTSGGTLVGDSVFTATLEAAI